MNRASNNTLGSGVGREASRGGRGVVWDQAEGLGRISIRKTEARNKFPSAQRNLCLIEDSSRCSSAPRGLVTPGGLGLGPEATGMPIRQRRRQGRGLLRSLRGRRGAQVPGFSGCHLLKRVYMGH